MFWFRHEVVQWLSPQMPQMRLVMKCASRGSIPFMKMSNPRKTIDVLWHLRTRWFAKSISVWIPRLPTMRVIGSHDISLTRTFCSRGVSTVDMSAPVRGVAGGQALAGLPPLRLDVVLLADVALAHASDDRPVGEPDDVRGGRAVAVLLHERHVLVG